MKADRRHELQQNELADWLTEQADALKPHAGLITICGIGGILIVLAAAFYFSGTNSAAARNWSEYFTAFQLREPEKAWEQLATQAKGTPAAAWALQSTGDAYLARGTQLLFSDKKEAKTLLEKAEKAYLEVLKEAREDELRARAEYALGKVYESLCNPTRAAEHYARAAELQKSKAIGEAAAKDAARMKDERQMALLTWFDTQEPKRPAGLPGLGGAVPGLPGSVPDQPDIGPPSGLGLDKLGTGTRGEPGPSVPPPAEKSGDAKAEEKADKAAPEAPGAVPKQEDKAEPAKADEAKAEAPNAGAEAAKAETPK